jgi:phage/plasmid-associated DNA primase
MGKYARFNVHANKVIERLGFYNVVEEDWAIDLDHMDDGLVPFNSCIINVATGARIAYDDTRDKYKLTKKVPYDYDPSMRCDEASHFLRERIIKRLYPEEALRIEVMKRFAVIMFTTRNADKLIMELYGNGNNGKTTLIECLAEVFPGFVYSAAAQDLTYLPDNNADKPEPWKIRAMGSGLIHVDEPKHGKPLDGSLLKLIRGGDKVSGRDIKKPQITYRPTYHPVITPNDLVEFKAADGAIMASAAPHAFEMPSYFTAAGEERA